MMLGVPCNKVRVTGPSSVHIATQPAFTYSKLTIDTLEKGVKYVQS